MSLSGLSDVAITSVANHHLLNYDTSVSKWVNTEYIYAANVPQFETLLNQFHSGVVAGEITLSQDWEPTGDDVDSTITSQFATLNVVSDSSELTSSWTHRACQSRNTMHSMRFNYTKLFVPQIHLARKAYNFGGYVKINTEDDNIYLYAYDMTQEIGHWPLNLIQNDMYRLTVYRYENIVNMVVEDVDDDKVIFSKIAMSYFQTEAGSITGYTGISGYGADGDAMYYDIACHAIDNKPFIIMYLGDENVLGTSLTDIGDSNPHVLKDRYKYHDLFITSVGVDGGTTSDLLDLVYSDILTVIQYTESPSVVIIFAGQNDVAQGVPVNDIIYNMEFISFSISATTELKWFATNYPRTDNTTLNDSLRQIARVVRSQLLSDGFIDTWRLLADPNNDDACASGYLEVDGFTLTPSAHAIIADEIQRKLRLSVNTHMNIRNEYI